MEASNVALRVAQRQNIRFDDRPRVLARDEEFSSYTDNKSSVLYIRYEIDEQRARMRQ